MLKTPEVKFIYFKERNKLEKIGNFLHLIYDNLILNVLLSKFRTVCKSSLCKIVIISQTVKFLK